MLPVFIRYMITEWDQTVNTVQLIKSKHSGYVDMQYSDGVTYTVSWQYFRSLDPVILH